MSHQSRTLIVLATLACFPLAAQAAINLGSAGNFAVLGGTTATNTGLSLVNGGDVGVSPGTAITGFPPGVLAAPYVIHAGDAVALTAQQDLTAAYNEAAGLARTQTLTDVNLGGLTLFPGVYFFATTAFLTGNLTLDANNDPNAQFVFQIGTALTTSTGSSVIEINTLSDPGCNVFWQIGTSATLGTNTIFQGHILALASITLNTGSSIDEGSALAINGAVTLDSNAITNCATTIPEPSLPLASLLGFSALGLTTRAHGRRTPRTA